MDRHLPPHLAEIVRAQVASGRFESSDQFIAAAILLMEEAAPADGSAAASGSVYELAKLRGVHNILQRAKVERDFILSLTAAHRELAHVEAILQMTAERVGRHVKANRTGFFRMRDANIIEFAPCWTDGVFRNLRGTVALNQIGSVAAEMLRKGETVVTENCRTDPAVDCDYLESIHATSLITVPIIRDRRLEGGFFVHSGDARPWTTAEVLLTEEVAELTWDAVERTNLMTQLRDIIGAQRGELATAVETLQSETKIRVEAESQVSRLHRMELVGQLTGGLAHDFNNMLAVIIGALNLVQRRRARGQDDIDKYLEAALDGAARAASLTQRLLAFSRRQPLAPVALDANKLAAGMDDLLRRTLGETIAIEMVLAAGLWVACVDPSQLENAMLNLAVNSRDAMPEGGKLTIETANIAVDETYAAQNDIAPGQYVRLTVSDTGCGMDEDTLKRAFEPFFTTKLVGVGTGLGLSQVFGFVGQSHGVAKIYSEPGHGTTVSLYLPRHFGDVDEAGLRAAALPAGIPRGDPREIVLVVEDEPRVRMLSVETIRELGYTVLHAESGAEALKIVERGQDVTVLFTDIVMPHMTGRELADHALKIRPQLKVIYATGYTRNAVVHHGVIDPGTNFLQKPFSIDKLANLLRAVLDK